MKGNNFLLVIEKKGTFTCVAIYAERFQQDSLALRLSLLLVESKCAVLTFTCRAKIKSTITTNSNFGAQCYLIQCTSLLLVK